VGNLEVLKAVARLGLLADDVKDGVDEPGAVGVVALGPVVAGARLTEDEVVRAEDLAVGAGADGVHGTGLPVHEDGTGHVAAKRPCSCCEWWLLYGSSATNWPDVIGQILWPLAYIVILILMLEEGWGSGAASACEQDIQVLCGVTLGDFMANDGRFGR
jgi:hypothetical protein